MTSQPAPKQRRPLSPEALAYLEQERDAETKSEFHGGTIVAMAGVSYTHALLVSRVNFAIVSRIGTSCEVLISDMRVFAEECEAYFYPDLLVVCDTPDLDGGKPPSLQNPQVIIEILSESTEGNDRGYKFECYRTIPTLREYVLIAQNKIQVEHYIRQNDTMWLLTILTGKDAILNLESCQISLPLSEIYARVFTP